MYEVLILLPFIYPIFFLLNNDLFRRYTKRVESDKKFNDEV